VVHLKLNLINLILHERNLMLGILNYTRFL